MANKMSIHINPDCIEIETFRNGQRSVKPTNLRAVQEVLTKGERIETPLLPSQWGVQKYVRVNNRELYAITTPPHVRNVKYDFRDDGINDTKEYEIPLPGLLWLLVIDVNPGSDTRKYVHGMAFALKNQILSMNDQLYQFPFANVDEHWMCWGGAHNYPNLGASKSIMTVPERFLNNPFNNHLDHRKYHGFDHVVNGTKVNYFKTSHLFTYLAEEQEKAKAEGKNASFKYDCLKDRGTFQQEFDSYMRQYLGR